MRLPEQAPILVTMDAHTDLGTHGQRLAELLQFIYGARSEEALRLIEDRIQARRSSLKGLRRHEPAVREARFSERDALLITYGDMIGPDELQDGSHDGKAQSALLRLGAFIDSRLKGIFTYHHILPFFPYSSDDGFSVMDYRAVNPALGSWADIATLGTQRRLAFDLVINHASAQGVWFKAFKAGRKPYERFFVTRPLDYDARSVLRPRTHPLISSVLMDDGSSIGVWTTFSADQVDLDFSEPEVFAEFVDIILEYAERGARMLRLDAIAYLWKEDGTSCAHLPQVHAVVKAIRAILDGLGLDVIVLTETNVPHEENMAYFGDGDEAHMVYNFSLPPLTLHAFTTGDAGPLSRWAASLALPEGATMLNFLASHDGVGVTPARGLVENFDDTIKAVQARGGLVSYKATPQGSVPYELNISWADAVSRPEADDAERSKALIASYAVACSMDGVPALYFHSMVGSRNWKEGPKTLAYNRAINRERPSLSSLDSELDNPRSMRSLSLGGLSSLLSQRAMRPAFSPDSQRKAYVGSGPVFMVARGSGKKAILVVINCSHSSASCTLPEEWSKAMTAFDPVAAQDTSLETRHGATTVPAYGVLWIEQGA